MFWNGMYLLISQIITWTGKSRYKYVQFASRDVEDADAELRIPWCEQTGMTRDWDGTRSRARVQITKPLCRAESGQEVLTLYYFPHPGTRPCFPVNLPETQLRPVSRWIVSLINRTHRGHSSFWFHVKPLSLRWIKKYIFGILFANNS